jgi:hypothetical protein
MQVDIIGLQVSLLLASTHKSAFQNIVLLQRMHLTDIIVQSEVITAVVMKNSLFWDITPCSPFEVSRRLGVTCRRLLQGPRIRQVRNRHEALLAICSETSVKFQRTTRYYIPEARTLNNVIFLYVSVT